MRALLTLPTVPACPDFHPGSVHGSGHRRYVVLAVGLRRVVLGGYGRTFTVLRRSWERWLMLDCR